MSILHGECEKQQEELRAQLHEKSKSIKKLEITIKELETKQDDSLINSYNKAIENIANIISPTDYKIIETISTLDDNYKQLIKNERLPELTANLNIIYSNETYTMKAINEFITDITVSLDSTLVDTELLEIATYGNRTELNFKTRYRSSYEDVTTDIVNFCTDHFMVERVLSNNRVRISSQARKPLIENSSKKDKLLKLKLVHY
jgi:hypothetical protein|tara:strand:- start:2057 stop:2668 length:612 start_codon:yes stop_codon:yes gene_type:complete